MVSSVGGVCCEANFKARCLKLFVMDLSMVGNHGKLVWIIFSKVSVEILRHHSEDVTPECLVHILHFNPVIFHTLIRFLFCVYVLKTLEQSCSWNQSIKSVVTFIKANSFCYASSIISVLAKTDVSFSFALTSQARS